MASYWTNKGKFDLANGGASGKTLRIMLVNARPASAGAAADLNFVADVVAGELAGTGYARKTLTTVAVTEDDANDWAKLAADNPATYAAINAGTIRGAWIFRQVGGSPNDATDILWCFLDTTDFATTGTDVSVAFGANGISTIS